MADSFPSLSHTSRAFPLPTIPEDTLHYTLHLPPSSELPSSSSSSNPEALATLITEHVNSLLTQPWLWNKDSWELKVAGTNKLEGRMRVGDAVDDEWLVVWLLREVSRRWPELVLSVRDNDGEFLLIEGANELPAWVSPENSENRLWLYGSHLHLLPLNIRSSADAGRRVPDEEAQEQQYDPEAYLSEEDAIRAVKTGKYVAEFQLESAIWERIAGYPVALKTHQHRTKAYLPVPVAKALAKDPELIQRAVEGFYVRDPAQLRAASRMTHFPPASSILSSVLMTRAAYAQLQGQVFHPPRVFGPEWSVREGEELKDERRWRDLGVKIATGFEIMYREGGKKGRSGDIETTADELRTDEGYRTYITNLKSAGFFGSELEGSEKWRAREKEAVTGWKAVRSADTTSQRPSFAFQVDSAIAAESSNLALTALEAKAGTPEDSESWLEVSPDELDAMMNRASGHAGPSSERIMEVKKQAEPGEEHGRSLQDLAKKVESFVGGEGDLQGARFEDELSDEDMDDDSASEDEDEPVLTALEKAERSKNLVPALPDEEWGRHTSITPAPNVTTMASQKPKPTPAITAPGPHMRPPRFAKQQYDGVVSDSDDSEDEADLPLAGTLGRHIAEMKWAEGEEKGAKIENIDDEDRKFGLGEDIDEAMEKAVWANDDDELQVLEGDGDIDMGNEEADFLTFAKDALGLTDDMWEGILSDRRGRGAFVPQASVKKTNGNPNTTTPSFTKPNGSVPKVPAADSSLPSVVPGPATPPANSEMNMELDSFDKVMEAMDAQLDKVKAPSQPKLPSSTSQRTSKASKSKGKKVNFADPLPPLPTEQDLEDMDEDDLEAMDRELKAALKSAGIDDVDDDVDDVDDGVEEAKELEGEGKREYEMMRDFLESYRSQAGQSGVVGNLFGRLGQGT